MKLEEQKDENVEVTQELRLTRYNWEFLSFFYSTYNSILNLEIYYCVGIHVHVWGSK